MARRETEKGRTVERIGDAAGIDRPGIGFQRASFTSPASIST
jgi:hypothetical protein